MKALRKNHGQTFRNAYASTAQNTHKPVFPPPLAHPRTHCVNYCSSNGKRSSTLAAVHA